MDKFENKYRIPSARAQWWDYGSNAPYFITICTKNREHFFGEIKNGKMVLSGIGRMAHDFWMEIPMHFSFVVLDEFVVMPNHIHGIIIIDKNDGNNDVDNDVNNNVETRQCLVSNNTGTNPKSENKSPGQKRFRNPGKGTVSSIIGSYKSIVTKNAHPILQEFDWQSRFHDHIIRNDDEFYRIKNYIANNPENWKEDKFNR